MIGPYIIVQYKFENKLLLSSIFTRVHYMEKFYPVTLNPFYPVLVCK